MPLPSLTKQVGLAALSLSLLTGCQSLGSRSFARMRVVNLSPGSGSVDIYQGNTAVAYNLSYGAVTSYVPLATGALGVTVDLAGSKQVLAAAQGSFIAGAQYTLLINNPVGSLQPVLLTDSMPPGMATAPFVRFIHQASSVGEVDVYILPAGQRLTSIKSVATSLAPGTETNYLPVPAGRATAIILPAGTVPSAATIALHTGTQIDYVNGSARSLILVDGQSPVTQGLQVISALDADPGN